MRSVANADVPLDWIRAEGNMREYSGDSVRDENARNLLDSVRSLGILEPVILTPINGAKAGHGFRYQLVAGFRRYTAACQSGMKEIPARILDRLGPDQIAEVRLVENLQRLDMNPIEEAKGLRGYLETSGLSQEAAAKRLGRTGGWASLRLGFLKLPEDVQQLIADRHLTVSNASRLVPYVDSRSTTWLIRAGKVGARIADNRSFAAALEAGLPARSREERHSAQLVCSCKCSCCTARGVHEGGANQ